MRTQVLKVWNCIKSTSAVSTLELLPKKLLLLFASLLRKLFSILLQFALESPIHGPRSVTARSSITPVRLIFVFFFVLFVCFTIRDVQDAIDGYAAERGLIEVSLVRQPYYNFSYGFLGLKMGPKQTADGADGVDGATHVFHANYPFHLWNSSDEDVLPPIDDAFWLGAAMVQDIIVSEGYLRTALLLHAGLQHSQIGDLFGFSTSAAATFGLLSRHQVNFAHVYKTVAVQLCLLVNPQIRHPAGIIDSREICKKKRVNGRQASNLDAVFFELPVESMARIASDVKHLTVSLRGNASRLRADVTFWLQLGRTSVGDEGQVAIAGELAAMSQARKRALRVKDGCFEARLRKRTPVLHNFQRTGAFPCREPLWANESRFVCAHTCAASYVKLACNCSLLQSVDGPTDGHCLPPLRDGKGSNVVISRECAHKLSAASSESLERCLQACAESSCRREAEITISWFSPYYKVCGFPARKDGSRGATVHYYAHRLGLSYDCIFTETPLMDGTAFGCVLGSILGNWTGSSYLACLHIGIFIAVCIFTNAWLKLKCFAETAVTAVVPFAASTDEKDAAAAASDWLYFHFSDAIFSSRGLAKVLGCACLAFCFSMQLYDTAIVVSAYVNEETAIEVTFATTRVDFTDPAWCFEIYPPTPPVEIPASCSDSEADERFRAYVLCLHTFMSLEQAIFFSTPTFHSGAETMIKCARLLQCAAGDKLHNFSRALSRVICSRSELSHLSADGSSSLISKCSASSHRWLGPYAPHRSFSVCFGYKPSSSRLTSVSFRRSPSTFLNTHDRRSFEGTSAAIVRMSNYGAEAFLSCPDRAKFDVHELEAIRSAEMDSVYEVSTSKLYEQVSLRRKPCSDDYSAFQCERQCFRDFLEAQCNYRSISYGDDQSLSALHGAFDNDTVECLRRLLGAADGHRDGQRCVRDCQSKERCTLGVHQFTKMSTLQPTGPNMFTVSIVHTNDSARLNYKKSRLYSDIEPVLATIGGSMGKIGLAC